MPTPTATTPPRPRHQMRRWPRSVGAFGMTATLLLGGAGGLLERCEAARPSPSERVIQITNQHRADNGRSKLSTDSTLMRVARNHSQDQARRRTMSHYGSNGSSPSQRLTRAGYRWSWWGENVAAGQNTAKDVMRAWMQSSGHRANILSGNFTEIGVGMERGSNGVEYWTMVLARPG